MAVGRLQQCDGKGAVEKGEGWVMGMRRSPGKKACRAAYVEDARPVHPQGTKEKRGILGRKGVSSLGQLSLKNRKVERNSKRRNNKNLLEGPRISYCREPHYDRGLCPASDGGGPSGNITETTERPGQSQL